uniref:Uncharacterized protein n=1 Tax=Parascaris equorum TaxID=6256 RepID=A0A914RB94_PAREQ
MVIGFQVAQLLQHSQSPDTQTQRNVQERLDQLNMHPEFCCYLVFILSELKEEQRLLNQIIDLVTAGRVVNLLTTGRKLSACRPAIGWRYANMRMLSVAYGVEIVGITGASKRIDKKDL